MTRSYNDLESEFKYLIVNEKDRKFGLWVNTVGFQSIHPHSPYPIKEHPSGYLFNVQKGRTLHEYQLLYITKGKGTFASDDTPERIIGKGNLIILFPGQWHTYSPDTATGWNEYYIGFEGNFIDQLIKNGFLSKQEQVLEIGLNEGLAALLHRLWKYQRLIRLLPSNIFRASYCILSAWYCLSRKTKNLKRTM